MFFFNVFVIISTNVIWSDNHGNNEVIHRVNNSNPVSSHGHKANQKSESNNIFVYKKMYLIQAV